MTPIVPTRLEKWLARRLARQQLSPDQLESFQRDHLNQTLAHARENSPFYRQRFKHIQNLPLNDLSRITGLPFTTAEDLRRHHLDMLCVSHSEVARIITMQTSGTSSLPKRLYFTKDDLESNIDFFYHGLTCFVESGQKVLIMLPSRTPDSVGDQLKRAAARIPATGYIHWPVSDLESLLDQIHELQINCLVGAPAQVFALCRYEQYHPRRNPNPLKSILLSTDYVPRAVVDEIRKVWGCTVFEHYGMTEMGLGCALECDVHQGYHLREADLLLEVIDPASGYPQPPGVEGEVVFTTLSRRAMPLIRYRTGDLAAWMKAPCACGTFLRRLGKVRGRIADLASTQVPSTMPQLDEAVLPLAGIYSFQAALHNKGNDRVLVINLFCQKQHSESLIKEVHASVVSSLTERTNKKLSIHVHTHPVEALRWDSTGMIKRTL